MNYCNSFTIRQEFERHLGLWTQGADDYWTLSKKRHPVTGWSPFYQDPYRRAVFARTPEAFHIEIDRIDQAMDAGTRNATVFFMTLGMAEVFLNMRSGKIACQKPGYAGGAEKMRRTSICRPTRTISRVSQRLSR